MKGNAKCLHLKVTWKETSRKLFIWRRTILSWDSSMLKVIDDIIIGRSYKGIRLFYCLKPTIQEVIGQAFLRSYGHCPLIQLHAHPPPPLVSPQSARLAIHRNTERDRQFANGRGGEGGGRGVESYYRKNPEPVFVNLLISPWIDSHPGGPVRHPFWTFRPVRLHRLAESIPGLLKGTWQWGGFSGVFAEIGSS